FDPELRCRIVCPFSFRYLKTARSFKQAVKKFVPIRSYKSPEVEESFLNSSTLNHELSLQSDRIFTRRRCCLARQRRPDNPAVLVEFHAQAEAHLGQYILDLVERLSAEVLGLQHFVLALLHEFADGLDVRVLQAVVGTHGKFQLFHRTVQM